MELLEGEVFKPLNVEGYEKYLVSNKGRVWNGKKFLIGKIDKDGYREFGLTVNNKSKYIRAHRMVAFTFIGEPVGDRNVINHKDCNRLNNSVENLEWVTIKENVRYSLKEGNRDPKVLDSIRPKAAARAKEVNSMPIEVEKDGIYTIYSSLSEARREIGFAHSTFSRMATTGKSYKGYTAEFI